MFGRVAVGGVDGDCVIERVEGALRRVVDPLQRTEVIEIVAERVPGLGSLRRDLHRALGELAQSRFRRPARIRRADPRLEYGAIALTQSIASAPGYAPAFVPVAGVQPADREAEPDAGEREAGVGGDGRAIVGYSILETSASTERLRLDVLAQRA